MLEALTDELSHPEDTLGCAAALRLVTQLAEKAGPAALGLLGKNLLSNLQRLFERGDDLLESSALTVAPCHPAVQTNLPSNMSFCL